jgi:hypothetical protein
MLRPLLAHLLLVLLSLCVLNAQAAVIDLRDRSGSLELPVGLEYRFSDTPLDSPALLTAGPWQVWQSKTLHLIGESRQLWLRVPLYLAPLTPWLLQSEWPQAGRIATFIQQGETLQGLPQLLGQRYPSFHLPAGQSNSPAMLYVAVSYSDIALLPLRLLTESGLQQWRERSNLWLGLFFGLGLAVILLNLCLWLSTRTAIFSGMRYFNAPYTASKPHASASMCPTSEKLTMAGPLSSVPGWRSC